MDNGQDLYRSVLRLHYWIGMTVAEISATLSAPQGTVKWRRSWPCPCRFCAFPLIYEHLCTLPQAHTPANRGRGCPGRRSAGTR